MNLNRELLFISDIDPNRKRVSYEPWDEVNPSCEAIIEVDSHVQIEGNGIDEPQFFDTIINGIEFIKFQVWDYTGLEDITDSELGIEFIKELEELILNELKG